MPNTKFLSLLIDGAQLDLGALKDVGIKVNYVLEEPENFERKQSSSSFGITVPATPANDKIFNTFHNPAVEDLTPGQVYRNNRAAHAYVNGTNAVIIGKALLEESGHTDKPEYYKFNIWGGNGDWALDMQNMTLWDCLGNNTHTFDVPTVEASWAFDGTDEVLDYVYAPVRYRQPFGDHDDTVTIYHLRPSLSIYWMLYRAFKAVGYSIESSFFDTDYFRRLVMPWTWGDFYDIGGSIIESIGFKAVGINPPDPTGQPLPFSGLPAQSDNANWAPFDGLNTFGTNVQRFDGTHAVGAPGVGGPLIVKTLTQDALTGGTNNLYRNFKVPNTLPINGHDPLGLYDFVVGGTYDGGMRYHFLPPAAIAGAIAGTVSLQFDLNLICRTQCTSGQYLDIAIQVDVYDLFGSTSSFYPVPELSFTTSDPAGHKGDSQTPTVIKLTVPGVRPGDYVVARVRYDMSTTVTDAIEINSSAWIADGAGGWLPEPTYTSLQMTGMYVDLGGEVDFKLYDAFKKYKLLEFIGGVIDMFDLELQTDNLTRTVCIEPMFSAKLNSTTDAEGYFQTDRIFDWTKKQDLSKMNTIRLFSGHEQQLDFTFKQDGADGGQNLWAARYKGVYLNGIMGGKTMMVGKTNNAVGVLAGVPGSSRYLFPDRFLQGNRQKVNRFFSATMHCMYPQWKGINGLDTQLVAIIPENINDTSASAVTQVFEPKIAYYKGLMSNLGGQYARIGGWRWLGDPLNPNATVAINTFPFMFAVNYVLDAAGNDGSEDPVLTYCDQKINGNIVDGLMKKFYLKRMAMMRNGQLYNPWVRLSLNDISNWKHRECIFLKQSMYALIGIDGYQPLRDESSQCTMWRVVPPIQADVDNCFPSATSVDTGTSLLSANDLRYAPMMCLQNDIPQILA